MWLSTIALMLLSINASQPGQLLIANDRLTYGHLGPARESAKYLPGDTIHLVFEVQNITFDADGTASYAMALEVLDPKGLPLLKQQPRNATTKNYLGGTMVAGAAHLQIPLESPPGIYTFRVNVVDNATKKSVAKEHKIEVLPKAFGLIQVVTSADREAAIAWSPVGVVGDSIYLNFSAVGFGRDTKTKQPHIKVVMRVLDDKGQATKAAAPTGEVNGDLPDNVAVVPMQFGLTLNRSGRFTLELDATDVLTGKSSKVAFPIRVLTP
jgi:hypothetical protein